MSVVRERNKTDQSDHPHSTESAAGTVAVGVELGKRPSPLATAAVGAWYQVGVAPGRRLPPSLWPTATGHGLPSFAHVLSSASNPSRGKRRENPKRNDQTNPSETKCANQANPKYFTNRLTKSAGAPIVEVRSAPPKCAAISPNARNTRIETRGEKHENPAVSTRVCRPESRKPSCN